MQPDPYTFHFLRPRNSMVLLGTVSGVAGAVTYSPHLLMLAAACYTAVIFSLIQAWRLIKNVRVRRSHHPRVFQHNTLGVTLDVTCDDEKAPELVLLQDTFAPATASRIRRLIETPLRKGTTMRVHYFGKCEHRRGLYILGPISIDASDVFGFFRRQLILDEFTNLTVYPQAVDLHQVNLLDEGTLAHVGLDTSRRTGVSEEFIGIREYRPGDSQRIVHWKSTARHGKIMVKEFQEELTTFVTFFLDLGRLGLVGIGDQTSVEYGIKACASLAKRAVERGHHVSLFTIGSNVDHIPLGGGTAHLLAILDRLALAKPEGQSAFAIVVGDLANSLTRGSTAVLIMGATTIEFDTLEPVIARFLDKQILPVIAVIDDRAFIKVYREQEERHHEALPLEEIVRQLRVMGARVHMITRAKSIEQALLQGLDQEEAV